MAIENEREQQLGIPKSERVGVGHVTMTVSLANGIGEGCFVGDAREGKGEEKNAEKNERKYRRRGCSKIMMMIKFVSRGIV